MTVGEKKAKQPHKGANLPLPATPLLQRSNRSCSPLVRLVVHVVCDVLNVIRAQALAEGRHGVLAIGDLILDGLHVVAASEVLLQRVLFDLLLGHDAVVAAGVAGCAIRREDALTVLQISGQSWAATSHSGKQPQSNAEGEWAPGARLLWLLCRHGSHQLLPQL